MSRQMGGRANGGGGVARGAGFAAAKGAGLIGLAVIIGIVLLQLIDDGETGPVSSGADSETTTTTVGAVDENGDDATPETTEAQLTPDQLSVLVLNGGAPQGAARAMSDALKQAGYTNQAEAADWPDRDQTGNVVLCRPEFTREAAALAVAVGEGTLSEAFPDPVPPGSDEYNCVVVVGAAG